MSNIKYQEKVILFCDIHNFSKIFLEIENEYPFFIQNYYEEIVQIIINFGGSIVKYVGDLILSYFSNNKEEEVILCAQKMRKQYKKILEKYDININTELEVGIGSGKIYLGIFGHKSLKQKDIFGVKVNETAVIAHHRGIAITEDVYKNIKNKIKLKYLGVKKVKWSETPLKIWVVDEDKDY